MSIILQGTITSMEEVESGENKNGKPFTRRRVIIDVQDGKFTRPICLTAWNEMEIQLSKRREGDFIEVECNIESRQVNDRWYTDVKPWRFLSAKP